MSDEPITNPEPEPTPAAETAAPFSTAAVSSASPAEAFISSELAKARKALLSTRIGAVVITLVFGGGLIYITSGFTSSLEPHAAAEIATGIMSAQINEKGPDLANQLKERIPALIAETPNYVKKEMPAYREAIEDRVEDELNKYARSTSDELGKRLDAYLEAHKDEIKGMMATAGDKAAVQQLGPSLKKELLDYIKQTPQNGESIMSQIDQSLKALQEVSTKVNRLAANKGLTPQETKTRKAIAVLARAIEEQRVKLTMNGHVSGG